MPDQRIISFDADTGELISDTISITGQVGARIASHCLPGMTPDDVDAAYGVFMEDDAVDEYPVGRVVLTGYGYHGEIIRRASNDGVLHSVLVRMDTSAGPTSAWLSPSQIITSAEGE